MQAIMQQSEMRMRGILLPTAPFKDIDFATQLFMQDQCKFLCIYAKRDKKNITDNHSASKTF